MGNLASLSAQTAGGNRRLRLENRRDLRYPPTVFPTGKNLRVFDGQGRQREPGFTLVELLVVMAVIGILAGLLLPALARSRARAMGIACLNNTRELARAWMIYAGENDDRLVYNLGGSRGVIPAPGSLALNWVNNVLSWELDRDNTNLAFLAQTPLASSLAGVPGVFTCPADHTVSSIQRRAGWARRVRSYSMNAMVGDAGPSLQSGTNVNNPGYRQYVKLGEFETPAGTFVFLDEHPDSINDGYFLNRLDDREWMDLPASYHAGAATLAFADGHAELHTWKSPTVRPPARPDAAPLPFAVGPGDATDFDWLSDRTAADE